MPLAAMAGLGTAIHDKTRSIATAARPPNRDVSADLPRSPSRKSVRAETTQDRAMAVRPTVCASGSRPIRMMIAGEAGSDIMTHCQGNEDGVPDLKKQ